MRRPRLPPLTLSFPTPWEAGALVCERSEVVFRQTMFAQVVRHYCVQGLVKAGTGRLGTD